MLSVFDFPKNQILKQIPLPLEVGSDTRFLLLPNKIICFNSSLWVSIDQGTGQVIDTFIAKANPIKAATYSLNSGILGILQSEPMVQTSPSIYQTRIAKLSQIDGSVEGYITIGGFNSNEIPIDLAVDDTSYYFLTETNGKRQIRQYLLAANQLLLLTNDLNNQVLFDRLKLSGENLLLMDSLENSFYEVDKINGRALAVKRQFSSQKVIDFNVKYNNLFLLVQDLSQLVQVSLSSEWAHVALQTNVYELATNGANQSLIRGTVFGEDETFLPASPLKVRSLKPLDLLSNYSGGSFVSLNSSNTVGDPFLPFLYKTDDVLYMHPDAVWEFILNSSISLEEIRLRFDSFRPGDIRIELFIDQVWEILEDLPLPLLFTREDLVFDNFFDKSNVVISGIRISNTTSNTIAFKRLILLGLDPDTTEQTATNYAPDTAQTLFFVGSPQTTINQIANPRFSQGRLFWNWAGNSEIVNESLQLGDIGAFLHSFGDSQETSVTQKVVLNQPVARIITASLFVKSDIIFSNPNNQNCGLKITIRDIDSNSQTYYLPFIVGSYNYKRFYKAIVPPFPVYDLDFSIVCQKDTKGSIQIDKVQLEEDSLHDFIDYQIPNIFIKAIYEY